MAASRDQPSSCYVQLRNLLAGPETSGVKYKSGTAAAFIVGAGAAAREAVPTLHQLGLSPIFILHYDSGEMYNLLNDFLHIDLQGLRTPGMAQREIDDLAEKGIQVVVGVATVPSTPPTSPREEYVYKIATLLLEQPYAASEMESEHLPFPSKRCLADMLNADALFMADQARELGWKVSAIKSDTESKVTATEDDSYWWQFKQKVSVS